MQNTFVLGTNALNPGVSRGGDGGNNMMPSLRRGVSQGTTLGNNNKSRTGSLVRKNRKSENGNLRITGPAIINPNHEVDRDFANFVIASTAIRRKND